MFERSWNWLQWCNLRNDELLVAAPTQPAHRFLLSECVDTSMALPFLDSITSEIVWETLQTAREHYVPHMAVFYIVSQKLLSAFFPRSLYENHKNAWKLFMSAYNFIMSAYSFITFVYLFDVVRNTQMFADECGPSLLFRSETFQIGTYYFYLSKYVEFLDTYFLVITGREVSWLQYFHHLGAPIDMWFLWYYKNEGIWIFAVFNSFIHTLMYAYYGFTALGVRLNALRMLMTSMQIVQLFSGNLTAGFYAQVPCYVANGYLLWTWCINNFYIVTLLVLFANFYIVNYLSKPKKPKAAAAGAAVEEKKQQSKTVEG